MRCKRITPLGVGMVLMVILFPLLGAQEQEKIDKYFKMDILELMEQEITTADKKAEKVADIPASVVVIGRQEIEEYGYLSLTEILENIPGLYSIDDYAFFGANFGIRGFWSGIANDNMVILVNGVHQVYDYSSNYPLCMIAVPAEAIDRIEVVRGPMSVVYGSGAFYGVINIFTNEASEVTTVNRISVSVGSHRAYRLFARTAGHAGNLFYSFNAGLFESRGIDAPLARMVKNPSSLPELGVAENHGTGGRLEENEKYFNFSGTFKNFFLDINFNDTEDEMIFIYPPPFAGSPRRATAANILFGYRTELSNSIALEGKITYSHGWDWVKFDYLFADFYGIQQHESRAWEGEFNAFITPSPYLDITAGLYYRAVLDVSNLYDLPSFNMPLLVNNYYYLRGGEEIITRALFTQAEYTPFKNLKLVAGIRLEQMPPYGLAATTAGGTDRHSEVEGIYDMDEVEIIPRFAVLYAFSEKHRLKLLYGKASNRPSFFQNTKNSLDPLRDNLAAEHIQTWELNYIGALWPTLTLNISVFSNHLDNLVTRIVRFDHRGDYQTWFGNAGRMETAGIEFTIQAEPFRNLRTEVSGLFQKTRDRRTGYETIDVAYSPGCLAYLKASYRPDKSISLALTGRYVGEMEPFWDESIVNQDGTHGARIGERVPGYINLDVNLRLRNLFHSGLYLNIRCANILNKEIRSPTFTNNPWADRGTLGYGRRFLITLGWEF